MKPDMRLLSWREALSALRRFTIGAVHPDFDATGTLTPPSKYVEASWVGQWKGWSAAGSVRVGSEAESEEGRRFISLLSHQM